MKTRSLQTDRITGFLGTRQEEMLEFLKRLARMETPSSDIQAQHRLLHWLGTRLDSIGMYTVRVPGRTTGGYLYARFRQRDRRRPVQLLLGHCDTVWPKGTLEQMPLERKGAILSGPGVFDMKAGITQIFFALKAVYELGLERQVEPLVLINSDEEIGSRESRSAITRLSRIANRALVVEPPLGPEGRLKTARKGLGRFTLDVKGRAAHAGLDPEKGVNAIVEMASLVEQLYGLNDFESGITVNVGLIEGGISPNTVAPSSRVVVDVRVPTHKAEKEITIAIRKLQPKSGEVRLEISGGFGRPPMEPTERNQRLWTLAQLRGKDLGLELGQAFAGGGSDANTSSQYTATLDGLGTPGNGAHASHEHIQVPELVQRTALLTLLLLSEPL